ncbi:MAG: hypothetical protein NTU65_07395, partial [Cyanobacteria bacterium]|nr:hypothetical protein [Cyanobacteriota bacterium]
MAATPLVPLKSLLIGLPLGLGALAIGFAAEGLIPAPPPLSAAMVTALQETPPPAKPVRADAREDLRGVAAQRLGQGPTLASLAAPQLAGPQANPGP